MKRILTILMENEPGALSRIIGLFSQRGYNIDSLCVAKTDDPTLSRLTICTSGDEQSLEQITKQVNKLIDVLRVKNITEQEHVERELMLVKAATPSSSIREGIKRNADIFRAQIIDVCSECYTLQMVGPPARLKAFLGALKEETTIIEVVRSGTIGLLRGKTALRAKQY
ncbi:MAG: acetolactate synthase small subunit [Gammaproteobacteria bacterium]|nr:acetolactate synthase small subunit [Gammaproteobacteria bacterium]